MSIKSKAAARRLINHAVSYIVLVFMGIAMVYPLLYMFFGTFKENKELFSALSLLPERFSLSAYTQGWNAGQYSFALFYKNTFAIVLPCVVFALISSSLVSYGFSRFRFKGRNLLFIVMLSTLMLPDSVTTIPTFILFNRFGWLNTYMPFIVPTLFATNAFFIFMMVQFFRGIPLELDDAAKIDGCNSFRMLYKIHLPLLKPTLFSVGIFQFIWTWNNFFGPLIYISDVKKYPLSLALKMSIDTSAGVQWNAVLAMSFLSIIPSILIFFFAQKYFVEGITTTGMKG